MRSATSGNGTVCQVRPSIERSTVPCRPTIQQTPGDGETPAVSGTVVPVGCFVHVAPPSTVCSSSAPRIRQRTERSLETISSDATASAAGLAAATEGAAATNVSSARVFASLLAVVLPSAKSLSEADPRAPWPDILARERAGAAAAGGMACAGGGAASFRALSGASAWIAGASAIRAVDSGPATCGEEGAGRGESGCTASQTAKAVAPAAAGINHRHNSERDTRAGERSATGSLRANAAKCA